jgi:hypothetical protein
MESILGLLILIADIYAIVKIIQSSAPGLHKLLWIVLIVFVPVLGLIAWYFMGPGGRSA